MGRAVLCKPLLPPQGRPMAPTGNPPGLAVTGSGPSGQLQAAGLFSRVCSITAPMCGQGVPHHEAEWCS